MKKKIWYIIIVFFVCLGCESIVKADDVENADDLITDVRPPKPFAGQQPAKKNPPTTKPHKKIILASPDNRPEEIIIEVDEDEQIKQILIEKAKKIYNENRDNIRLFLIRWVCNIFYVILALYWLLKLFNWVFGNRAGFIILWLILLIACLTCVIILV